MQHFIVTGMSCAACSARVEKAVSKVEGVTSCSVSLLTTSMGVEGTAADQAIIQAVEAAGYGASVKGEAAEHSGASSMAAEEEMLKDHDTGSEAETSGVAGIFDCTDVFFHGTHDVGMAAAGIF